MIQNSLAQRPGQRSRYSDSLRAGWSGDHIPMEARFSAPVQTGCGAHPASYTKCNGSLSPGVKRPGRGLDHPPHLAPMLKKEQSFISRTHLGLRGLFQGDLYLCSTLITRHMYRHCPFTSMHKIPPHSGLLIYDTLRYLLLLLKLRGGYTALKSR